MKLHEDTKKIADRAWYHVNSVPYKVSLRWLFYRLLQEGYYKEKGDYDKKFMHLMSRLRHHFVDSWCPDTLADESREALIKVKKGERDISCFNIPEHVLKYKTPFPLDHFYRQEHYIEIWYEANAMTGQFEYYTKNINLVPCGGQASIPYKWEIAKRLEEAYERYEKPIVILFFGDCDKWGELIKDTIERDVSDWCFENFDLVWCGLTKMQARLYNVPENPEKPGFQWEALLDEQAAEIINESVERYVDLNIIDVVELEQEEMENTINSKIKEVLKREFSDWEL